MNQKIPGKPRGDPADAGIERPDLWLPSDDDIFPELTNPVGMAYEFQVAIMNADDPEAKRKVAKLAIEILTQSTARLIGTNAMLGFGVYGYGDDTEALGQVRKFDFQEGAYKGFTVIRLHRSDVADGMLLTPVIERQIVVEDELGANIARRHYVKPVIEKPTLEFERRAS